MVTLVSCSEDEEPNISDEIVGKWQLIEQLLDPGDGSGVFKEVDSDKTITFLSNGTYTSNGSFCFLDAQNEQESSGSYDPDKMTIAPGNCPIDGGPSKYEISYKIEESHLIISYPCIEPCAQKFKKIE
ncbi:hypothetical protein QQ008_04475 [Fulvivirgaceae bacterium BMA10]|uniref:Lipocalin-like domain-containing protein n=1 Tax=Splendidivirga corallicola TaxID=3051826 RepID=A0ABT8KLJ5_9BACT|nr:hypothetical protein [Fulvivirgaceae bacterium BMA10]